MKIELVNKKGNFLKFILSDTDAAFANAIRRIMINKVPTMAIQEVEFRKNNSILYDEMIAHRLGLLPLKTDLKSYEVPPSDLPEGEYLAKSHLKLTLSAKGPKTVYASEIKSADPKVVPVNPKTPIVKLLEGQELEFEAIASLGYGKDHAKHSPAHVYFTNDFKINVNNDSEHFEEFKEKYPEDVFKNGKIDADLIIKNQLSDACEGVCDDIVSFNYDSNSFVFDVESWGQLDPKEIVIAACEKLKDTSDEFAKEIGKLEKAKK
ncbi:MAG: DNA-directed RNA polymerase subunit D [Candidatus Woesearchaeota archaeon]